MKKLISIILFVAMATVAVAQTPDVIISRMDEEMNRHDAETEGLWMTLDMKIPILGTYSTRTCTLGDKTRMEVLVSDDKVISWFDNVNEWVYNSADNEVVIQKREQKEKTEEGDVKMFNGITDGYNVSIDKETADAWYLCCKKSKSNPDKDAPSRMDLVVAKGTYMPISLSAKMSGIRITMREIKFGVTESDVTFDAKKYPNVTIVDKRENL